MLRLLDGVTWDGVPVPGERGHALLALLALATPHAVAVGALVERLWPDEEPAHPEKALQVLVSRTRSRTVPDAVVHGVAGYRLGLREDQVDALHVRQLVRQAREAREAGDLDVARHSARDALAVRVAESGDGPLGDLADAIRAEQDTARRLLGGVLLARGDEGEALPLLEDALARRPADEDLVGEVLRAVAATRGVPAALERYAAYVERTLDATGAEPGAALRRLHAELLARDAPVREGLQYEAAPMVGRDDAVADVRALLDGSRVVTMMGPGGLGKTRMAHLVGRLAHQPVVYFVELAGVTSPDGVPRKVAADLGVRDSVATRPGQKRGTDLRARLAEKLAGAPCLLILDNCEHLIEAVADLVAYLVATTEQVRVLTTSRAPLGIAAEQVYPLAQLDVAEAVELFGQRARAARPGVRLDVEEVGPLVARLDGLPLAIELAAAKVRVMAVAEISRRLGDRFALLAGGDRSAPERHRTLEAVIGWSWNLLREEDRDALRRLSTFPDGFSLDGAEALLGRDPLLSLSELVEQSLLVVTETGSLRYRFLETVREYGLKQLADEGEREATYAALRAWAVGHGRELGRRLFTRDQVAVMGEVRAEVGNLAGAMRAALDDGDQPAVVTLAGLLAGFWSIEGDHVTVISISSPVLDLVAATEIEADTDEQELIGTLCLMLVNEAVLTGAARQDALERLREIGPGSDARTAAMRTLMLRMYGDGSGPNVAALEELSADDDPVLARNASQWLSQALENLGDVDGARAAAERALALSDGSDGPWSAALVESMLSGLASQTGDVEGCIRHARRALAVMEELGASQDILELRAMIGLCDLRAGRLEIARQALEELAENPLSAMTVGWSAGPIGLGELAIAQGDVDRGLHQHRLGVDIARGWGTAGERRIDLNLSPWVLFSESSALWVHVLVDRTSQAADLEIKLRSEVDAILGDDTNVDYPVSGCVLLALGGWDLVTGADPERAVRALALAHRFAYQRALPSMAWENVERLVEQHAPGLLALTLASYADRLPASLREEAAEVVRRRIG